MKFKVLYFLSKLHGVSPFRYNWISQSASPSTSSTVYCVVHAIFLSILALSCEYFIFHTTAYGNLKFVAHIVGHLEIISTIIKFIVIVSFQIVHRRRLVAIVNKVVVLNREIREVCAGEDYIYYNDGLISMVGKKLYLSMIQLSAFIYSISLYMLHENVQLVEYFTYFMGLYTQIVPMMVTSYYYCGLVLHCLQYFRIINKKLLKRDHCNDTKSCHNVNNETEKIGIIFGSKKICTYFYR